MLNQNTPAFIAHPCHGGDFYIVRPPQYDIHNYIIHTVCCATHFAKCVRLRLLSFTTYAHPRYHYKAHTLRQFIK